jgi:hypothetical protein
MILAHISDFYVLSFEEPDRPVKPKDWSLEVVDAQGHKRSDISLAYSRPQVTCPQQAAR